MMLELVKRDFRTRGSINKANDDTDTTTEGTLCLSVSDIGSLRQMVARSKCAKQMPSNKSIYPGNP